MNSEDMTKLGLVSKELERKDNLRRLENLDKLKGVNHGLGSMERQRPGSRPDGDMAAIPDIGSIHNAVQVILAIETQLRNDMADARRLVDNFEEEQIRLESKIAELEARLSEERTRCARFEGYCQELKEVLRSAASIMVNGGKDKE